MRWVLAQQTHPFHCWKLEQNEFYAGLKYNKKSHSFRIAAADKRLFFIEKTGFLQHKFLIKTEYSLTTGEIFPVKHSNSGFVLFENRKCHYSLKETQLNITSTKENFSISITINNADTLDQNEFCALLFGALWVVLSSGTKQGISLRDRTTSPSEQPAL
jgi:hypothetical protein